jgi:hypothetical protein
MAHEGRGAVDRRLSLVRVVEAEVTPTSSMLSDFDNRFFTEVSQNRKRRGSRWENKRAITWKSFEAR